MKIDATFTYTASVFVGLRKRYSDKVKKPWMAMRICRRYCDKMGLGLTITPTSYLYTDGYEPGIIVGLINYPRFPSEQATIRAHAMEIAKLLLYGMDQARVTVISGNDTFMLSA